ncbi:class I SAM-dependent methyltransferase [Anaeromicrobium sediminis]|uniref:Methyltransferase domain-containing protein n=1 Tax=Anaeromicrobium sediminis TaxID=1478221 RepID=A0A267MLG9_9FIRM|nr:class I SAM-dependent methyltransferase [Anaeromicrobium sediminis]PAB60252.1 hypothetical protein CCE28_04960 [Anaeromicrobium sediminis]
MSLKFMWDFWAKYYDKLWVQKYSLTPTRNKIIDNLKIDENFNILDAGCGIGELLRDIKDKFNFINLNLYGIDYSPYMIKRAKHMDSTINYENMDVSHVDKHYSNMDYILCSHSFPYYKNKREILKKFHRVLKEDGTLLLAQASENSFYDKLALFFVKFTTGKAQYLSINNIRLLSKDLFELEKVEIIKEKSFMPSIVLFVLRKI